MMSGPYGQDEAFVAVLVVGFTILLLVCWIAEYFCGGDK
jgi:hypothetical protein